MWPEHQSYLEEKKELSMYIKEKKDRPLTHRVLQNFPPNKAFQDEVPNITEWIQEAGKHPRELHLYVSIPFCTNKGLDRKQPEKCGFCLFPTLPFSRRNHNDYLDAILNYEIPMYAEHIGKQVATHPVDTIFLGGGTPNILSNGQYSNLLEKIKSSFLLNNNVEITTEGAPELFSIDKINHFKALGGTRISIGVQQFNENLLRLSGRKVSKKHVRKMIVHSIESELSVSVDLIYGWPDQTLKQFIEELKELVDIGVPRITAYPLNISHTSVFANRFGSRVPDKNEMKTMFYRSREFLILNNYTPITLNDYERKTPGTDTRLRHEIAMRNEHTGYRVGFGFAAASKLLFLDKGYGITYRNSFNRENGLNQYISSLKDGNYPVESYFKYAGPDLMLNYISGALQSFFVDLNDFSTHFPSIDFKKEFDCLLEVLTSLGWITLDENTLELTPEGQFFTDIIQGSFFHKRIKVLKQDINDGNDHGRILQQRRKFA